MSLGDMIRERNHRRSIEEVNYFNYNGFYNDLMKSRRINPMRERNPEQIVNF